MELDENGNPITPEGETEEAEDTTDYKSLYEQEKAEREKAQSDKERFEKNFKNTAKQLNELKKGSQENGNVAELVSKQVAEEMYYANNPVAKEYQKEIKEIQSKTGMTPEDAMTFYLAKNKPELISKKSEI
jgi:dsDNA-specific endonuclease/ATPase MutS2